MLNSFLFILSIDWNKYFYNMKNCITIFIFSIFCLAAKADEANTLWQLANHAYQNKNYEAATHLYDSMFRKDIGNAELYYNAGNAYFKSHKMGMAVWCYEKAYQLLPNDEDIETNLKISRLRLVDKIDAAPEFVLFKWWNSFLKLLPVKIWAIVSVVFLWLMLIGLGLYYFSFNFSGLGKTLIWSGLFFGILFLIITWLCNQNQKNNNYAIVVASNTTIKSAPDDSSSDLFVVHEGLKLKLNKANGDWVNVSIADGKVGWCNKNDFKKL
jgi:tetratricopeptide (TPR) repeat protein